MKEKLPTPEWSEDEIALIHDLRDGREEADVQKRLIAWAIEEEKKMPPPEGSIALDRKRARLYEAVGMLGSAWDSLNAAREQAGQIGDDALIVEIDRDMDAFEGRHKS